MKTKEELKAIRDEIETLGAKLSELTEDELNQVAGGRKFLGENEERIWPFGESEIKKWEFEAERRPG